MELTQELLKSRIQYYSESGIFTWIDASKFQANKNGKEAGRVNSKGYRTIRIEGKEYNAHRLAWLYVYGSFPKDEVDHINCEKLDNRICNLREASRNQNAQNFPMKCEWSKSGVRGVLKYANSFRAQIYANGKSIKLGSFDSAESAAEAYLKAKRELHPFFAG